VGVHTLDERESSKKIFILILARIEKLRASAPDDLSRWREEWTTRGLSGHKRNASTLAQLVRLALLASTDTARNTNKVRGTIAGKSNPVIHLRAEIFAG